MVSAPAGHAPRPERLTKPEPKPAPEKGAAGDALDLHERAGNSAVAASLGRSRGDLIRSVLAEPGRPVGQEVVDLVRDTTGGDASEIVVHDGPQAGEAASSVDAEMFASGNHIVAPKGLDVSSRQGVFGTVHEVHHILEQQAKGPVAGTDSGDGLSISDPDDRFEQEADAAGADAVEQRFS